MKKKKLLIILTLLICLIMPNVNASTFNASKIKSISIVKRSSTTTEHKHPDLFTERETGKTAYCIEPFVLIDQNKNYTEYPLYDVKSGYSKEQMSRINDLAYFGYGYGNHTDLKWVSITQMLIWRTTNSGDSFEWLDNLNDRNVINPYDNEIAEIESLIANKNKKPSFASNVPIVMTNHLELIDTNNVLDDFEIKETKGINVRKENNKLIIDQIEGSDSGEISLIKTGSEQQGKFFYDESSQNILVRGGATDVEANLKVRIVKGSIKIKKIDEDLNNNDSQGEGKLNNAIFGLYDYENNFIKEITLDEKGEAVINDLYLGHYLIKEISPGDGYKINDNIYDIELTEENRDFEIVIPNKIVESKIKIIKLYGSKTDFDNGTMKKEANINFDIFDKDDNLVGTLTTDEYGTCEIVLPYGTYKLVQKNTTANYQMIEDKTIVVDENSEKEIVIELYDVEIEVPNAGVNIDESY